MVPGTKLANNYNQPTTEATCNWCRLMSCIKVNGLNPGLGADGFPGDAHADGFGLVGGDRLGDPCLTFYV